MNLTISLLNIEIERGLIEIRKTNERIKRLEKELDDARIQVAGMDEYVADLKKSKATLEGKEVTLKVELDGKKLGEQIARSLDFARGR